MRLSLMRCFQAAQLLLADTQRLLSRLAPGHSALAATHCFGSAQLGRAFDDIQRNITADRPFI
jgi:hypothetical protein